MQRPWWLWWMAWLSVPPFWSRERTLGEFQVQASLGRRWSARQADRALQNVDDQGR